MKFFITQILKRSETPIDRLRIPKLLIQPKYMFQPQEKHHVDRSLLKRHTKRHSPSEKRTKKTQKF